MSCADAANVGKKNDMARRWRQKVRLVHVFIASAGAILPTEWLWLPAAYDFFPLRQRQMKRMTKRTK